MVPNAELYPPQYRFLHAMCLKGTEEKGVGGDGDVVFAIHSQ